MMKVRRNILSIAPLDSVNLLFNLGELNPLSLRLDSFHPVEWRAPLSSPLSLHHQWSTRFVRVDRDPQQQMWKDQSRYLNQQSNCQNAANPFNHQPKPILSTTKSVFMWRKDPNQVHWEPLVWNDAWEWVGEHQVMLTRNSNPLDKMHHAQVCYRHCNYDQSLCS